MRSEDIPYQAAALPSSVPPHFEPERAEVENLLQSGALEHCPRLQNFLVYVCRKYFNGEAAQIKEYSIAVDALGRAPSFDPEEDSIVRVEAHRLRKRLQRYYATAGAHNELHVELPLGQYAPRFTRNGKPLVYETAPVESSAEPALLEAEALATESSFPPPAISLQSAPLELPEPAVAPCLASTSEQKPVASFSLRSWHLTAAIGLVVSLVLIWVIYQGGSHIRAANVLPAAAPLPPVTTKPSPSLRILVGSTKPQVVGRSGEVWVGDRYFLGGEALVIRDRIIGRTSEPEIFRAARVGEFQYDIPLQPGRYILRLHFAETLYGPGNLFPTGGESTRVFHVSANGVNLLTDMDIIASAGGPNTAVERVFCNVSPAADGYLHLAFRTATKLSQSVPLLNGIEIEPASGGRLPAIRILPRQSSYVDLSGRTWLSDRYYVGGRMSANAQNRIQQAQDPALFGSTRFGNFSYAIPVPPGRYRVSLGFAELYFGAGPTVGGGEGSRLFDVYCNGVAVLRHFDIFREAGGYGRPVVKVLHGISPNAQGNILLSFIPIKNYASVNSIEVAEEEQSIGPE